MVQGLLRDQAAVVVALGDVGVSQTSASAQLGGCCHGCPGIPGRVLEKLLEPHTAAGPRGGIQDGEVQLRRRTCQSIRGSVTNKPDQWACSSHELRPSWLLLSKTAWNTRDATGTAR